MRLSKLSRILFIPFLLIPLLFVNNNVRNYGTVIYYFVFTPFLAIVMFLSMLTNRINMTAQQVRSVIYLVLLILIILFNYNSTESKFFYYLLMLFAILLFFKVHDFKIILNNSDIKLFKIGVWVYYLLSLGLYFSGSFLKYEYNDEVVRYVGLFLSSSVMGVISLSIFILYLKLTKEIKKTILLFVFTLTLLYLGKSRIDFLLGVFLPFFFFFVSDKKFDRNKRKIFFISVLILLLFYPIYDYIKHFYTDFFRANTISSDNSRFHFSLQVFQELKQSDFLEYIFGHGTNASFSLLENRNIKPHNDFLRIIYDYGIMFFLLFFKQLYEWFKVDKYICYLIIIYMTSFYHNMIFDMYILMFIMFSSKIKIEQNERVSS